MIHPLTDDRRILPIEKTGEMLEAAPGFQLVISYNPGYQHVLKDLKPSTRQRFVALEFDFPPPSVEAAIVAHESGVEHATAITLVSCAAAAAAQRPRARRGAEHAAARRHGAADRGGIPSAPRARRAHRAAHRRSRPLGGHHDLVSATI